ncbi:hypothetical protein BJD99_04165 [Rhodococcus sp. 1163]|uniref:maleylpyruvate isomerase family mycothiol-dependent enzyme n=1 Tax=Rhodococcus sp. 1163 TaxID=1905289 RepID=UPI0009FF01C6|nr:maleylpyruvate isomerase family mycothiol-dependent enzyme [Rhodococcus sp. 1163]ORI19394.1 hypothetical protein BJD99_04165 [Rhodococcus sp. 1163]
MINLVSYSPTLINHAPVANLDDARCRETYWLRQKGSIMDVTTLHTATEVLAEYLSEVTHGDLRQLTPLATWDIGDLYVHLIDQNIDTVAGLVNKALVNEGPPAEKITRSALEVSAHLYGGGYEERYRRTARRVEEAFAAVADAESTYVVGELHLAASAWYEEQVNETVIHTWDLTEAMGFTYRPTADVALRVLKTQPEPPLEDIDAAWEAALRKSGRIPSRTH